jgi:hypothetical protein
LFCENAAVITICFAQKNKQNNNQMTTKNISPLPEQKKRIKPEFMEPNPVASKIGRLDDSIHYKALCLNKTVEEVEHDLHLENIAEMERQDLQKHIRELNQVYKNLQLIHPDKLTQSCLSCKKQFRPWHKQWNTDTKKCFPCHLCNL